MKRILSVFLMYMLCVLMLFGCDKTSETDDYPIISNDTVKVGLLLSSNNINAELIESGLDYAHSVADTVNLDRTINIEVVKSYYTDESDIQTSIDDLQSLQLCAVICDAYSDACVVAVCDAYANSGTPVLMLSPYSENSNQSNIYTLAITTEYLSSCAAVYAKEKGYSSCAVLLYDSTDYYRNLAETYKFTLFSYIGVEPTAYYINGELANYNASLLTNGAYDYIFLVCDDNYKETVVSELKSKGLDSEIILSETYNSQILKNEAFNSCSFITKLESDSNNNILTMFLKSYAEYRGVSESAISAAEAYGYDAYMTVFEALKSFSASSSIIFSSTTAAIDSDEDTDTITISDCLYSFDSLTYYGVTDIITFSENTAIPTYIYVDNIINSDVVFGSKYSFNANSNSDN